MRRYKPQVRRELILAAAAALAASGAPYHALSREAIARAAGVSGPALQYHFGTMVQFRRDLMRYAIRHELLPVVAQGLAADDAHARRAPPALREKAAKFLISKMKKS